MKKQTWNYYNHGAIPTCAPHEDADLTPIADGNLWKDGYLDNGGDCPKSNC